MANPRRRSRGKLQTLERFHPKSREELRSWLVAHHESSSGVWLVTYKKASGKPRVHYEAIVEELLCFGWVDSLPRALDETRSMLLCTPRNEESNWSALNKARAKRMLEQDKMFPRGKAAIAVAKKNGAWDRLNDVEALVVPEDLSSRFDAHPGSRENFDAFPRSAKRGILEWIDQAKRPATRAKRIEETARLAAENVRANQWPRKR